LRANATQSAQLKDALVEIMLRSPADPVAELASAMQQPPSSAGTNHRARASSLEAPTTPLTSEQRKLLAAEVKRLLQTAMLAEQVDAQ
jgi:hypothetical protein